MKNNKLSIIIVNYNVKYFLEQCLNSVFKAIKNFCIEVIVVDNNSVDGSCQMLKSKFSEIILIENKTNTGFSYANNQAIKISTGDYVLLLNPDTLVEEDTFEKCISFMNNTPKAGALGVKMIDGKGNFLAESKRSLPTPIRAFYKVFGLSFIFPKSKIFGEYQLNYLDKDKIHKVDILSGAYMFIRKSVLDKIDLLDESFFMYGEDIDLSYRIIKAGYENYYFSDTTIIHYKGESTKKGSLNYVRIFYNAMIIFAKKHFSSKNIKLFIIFINIAIYIRAFLSIFKRIVKVILLPILDFISIWAIYFFIIPLWELYKFGSIHEYPPSLIGVIVPIYIIIWIVAAMLNNAYNKTTKIYDIIKGVISGTVFILILYALIPETYRYSRALIIIGSLSTFMLLFVNRYIFSKLKIIKFGNQKLRVVIVGNKTEAERVYELIQSINLNVELLGFVSPDSFNNNDYIGTTNQLNEIVYINKINEIIFCSENITSSEIIKHMLKLNSQSVNYKIAPSKSHSIIGSNSIYSSGELYKADINLISQAKNRINKRFFDIASSLLFFIFLPILFFFINKPWGFIKNIFLVLFAYISWVGYTDDILVKKLDLPSIKRGILNPTNLISNKISNERIQKLNLNYAQKYSLMIDISIVIKNIKYLGQ